MIRGYKDGVEKVNGGREVGDRGRRKKGREVGGRKSETYGQG